MISNLTVGVLFTSAMLYRCSSNPIADSQQEVITKKMTPFSDIRILEDEDIVSTMAAEFLFLVAGDHILLPAAANPEEDQKLHKTAQVLARLLTKLNCIRRVYTLLNDTAQEMAINSWFKQSGSHLFSEIFDSVLRQLTNDSELYAEFLLELNNSDNRFIEATESHGNLAPTEKKTFYDITPQQMAKTEKLLRNKLVKKVVLSTELLKQADQRLADIPKSAELFRKHVITAKAIYRLASSTNLETSSRIQQIFDETANEAMGNFEVITSAGYEGTFYDTLRTKIEKDDVLKNDFEVIKESLLYKEAA